MSSATIAATRPTLADRFIPRSAVNNALLILGGTALVAGFAQISIPLYPVPITGQTLAVLLVGATLGAWRGVAALGLYMVLGLVGLPIFSGGGHGLGPTVLPSFGFIIGFVLSAGLIGWLSERHWDRRPVLSVIGFFLASLIPFLTGVPFLMAVLHLNLEQGLEGGVYPFIIGGIIKWAIAAGLLPLAWWGVRKVDANSKKD